MLIPVLPQTPFNYSYLASGATQDLIVADNIPVANAKTIALSVRIHRLTLTSGASFRFLIYGVDPSNTDGTVFVTSATIGDTGTITTSSPNLVGLRDGAGGTTVISDPVYPFIRVVLQTKGPTSTGTTYAELSADLVVRQAVESNARMGEPLVQEMVRALYRGQPPRARGMLSEFPKSIGLGAHITAAPPGTGFMCADTEKATPKPKPSHDCEPTHLVCVLERLTAEYTFFDCPTK